MYVYTRMAPCLLHSMHAYFKKYGRVTAPAAAGTITAVSEYENFSLKKKSFIVHLFVF